jgi:predicted Zn-dependent peptidase
LIGSFDDLNAASLEDIAHFFATYYTPDNAVLTIAGDFDPGEARELVESYFAAIPRGKGKPPLPDMTLPLTFGGTLRETVKDDVSLPRLYLAFRSPPFGSNEYYAASVAGAILGMRKGSRLQRELVREREVATDATAFTFDLPKGADILVVDVTARPGITPERLEQEVVNEIERMRLEGVTQNEVDRAIALIGTDFVASMQQAAERADQLSRFATYFGDPSFINDQMKRYRSVTSDDVSKFVATRFGEDNRAFLMYVPRDDASTDGSTDSADADAGLVTA